jgi:PAS domain S-box-containing protein
VSVSTIPDPAGRPNGFVVILSDVTERRKAEYLVRKSEEKHRSLVEGISHIIFTTDTRGRFTYVSPVIQEILGYNAADLIGKYFYTLVPSDQRHILGDRLKEAQEGKLSPNDFRMVDTSGSIHWGRIIAQPLIEGSKRTGITGLIEDITDLKHSEEALRQSEEKLNLAIEGSGVGLWDWRVQSGEVVINDRFADTLGYTLQELEPLTIETLRSMTHPDDAQRSEDLLRKHFAGEEAGYACEIRMMHKEGHWVWVLDRGKVTERNKEGTPSRMTGTILDISERKASEEALRQVNRKLNFISSLSRHDILNRVSVLLGYLDRAKTMTTDTALMDHLDRIEVSTKTIGKLVQFTRDFKDLGIHPPKWFAIEDIVLGVSKDLGHDGISLSYDVGDWEIYADPQITRVFTNIFDNTRIHGKTATEISIHCTPKDHELLLIIEDNGVGIAAEMKQEIFEPGMIRNQGFGLFLAKEILSITGLTLEENGTAGKGSRFEIRIPPGSYRLPKAGADIKVKTSGVTP